jgi:hypothetical protein
MYGSSTGRAPIQVKRKIFTINIQNINFKSMFDPDGLKDCDIENGSDKKIKIDIIRATTPPNLSGIDRKMA